MNLNTESVEGTAIHRSVAFPPLADMRVPSSWLDIKASDSAGPDRGVNAHPFLSLGTEHHARADPRSSPTHWRFEMVGMSRHWYEPDEILVPLLQPSEQGRRSHPCSGCSAGRRIGAPPYQQDGRGTGGHRSIRRGTDAVLTFHTCRLGERITLVDMPMHRRYRVCRNCACIACCGSSSPDDSAELPPWCHSMSRSTRNIRRGARAMGVGLWGYIRSAML